jgi:hypothetical protein
MKPDSGYLTQHYASLSDDTLLAIDRSELVDTAQKCYDAEVEKRGIGSGRSVRSTVERRAVAEEQFEEEAPEDWLEDAAEVYSLADYAGSNAADSAANAREVLEAAGVPCQVELIELPDEEKGPHLTKRWRVLVPAYFNLHAMSLLERAFANHEFEAVWKTHLENLSDDELLGSHPETVLCGLFDRVDRVLKAYEEEIGRRGLET